MKFERLTFEKIVARPVVVRLNRPVVARIATMTEWPIILIDLYTKEGIIGKSYLEPYLIKSMAYILPALNDFNDLFSNEYLAPIDMFEKARKSLHFVGYEGLSLIAVSGLDMAVWDAMAKSANLPLCNFLGGSLGPVKAYNSNGLWLKKPEKLEKEAVSLIEEGGFEAVKLRLGRENLKEDVLAVEIVRKAVGDNVKIMVDYNQSLTLDEAIARCKMIDNFGLSWIEEPIVYDNLDGFSQLSKELTTPIQIGENFYGPRELYKSIQKKASDLVMPDFMRIGGVTGWLRSAAIAAEAGIPISTHLYPEVGAHVMRVSQTAHWLEWVDWANVILKNPFEVTNGSLEIPALPGLGIEWDEKSVSRHLYEL